MGDHCLPVQIAVNMIPVNLLEFNKMELKDKVINVKDKKTY